MFATLTNAYAIVAIGASENFYRWVIFILGQLISMESEMAVKWEEVSGKLVIYGCSSMRNMWFSSGGFGDRALTSDAMGVLGRSEEKTTGRRG